MTGVILLTFFILLAAIAPLLTPYDPYRDQGISSATARPSWFTIFDPKMSRDALLIAEPRLTTPESFNEFQYSADATGGELSLNPLTSSEADRLEWSILKKGEEAGKLSIYYSRKAEGGSVDIIVEKKAALSGGVVEATLLRPFNYTFKPPPKFRVNFELTAQTPPEANYRLSVFIANPEGKTYRLWDSVNRYDTVVRGGGGFSTKKLTAERFSIDSYLVPPAAKLLLFRDATANSARSIISAEGRYAAGLTFTIRDTSDTPGTVRFSLHLMQVRIDGDASGYLGTDQLGRDIFTQLIYGTRWALYVGVLSAAIGVVFGVSVGMVSGYIGGVVDEILMRAADFILVLPFLPFLLVLAVLTRPSVDTFIWIIALLGWPSIARLIRSLVLSLKAHAFVEAAKAYGGSTAYVLIRHMLPNISPVAFTQLVLFIPLAIITLTAITFLGLGDATVIDWGYMTSEAFRYGFRNWWWILPPGLLTALLSSSFLFIGYAMDEILNPRLRRR